MCLYLYQLGPLWATRQRNITQTGLKRKRRKTFDSLTWEVFSVVLTSGTAGCWSFNSYHWTPYLSFSASFPLPPFDFILWLFPYGSKRTPGNFAFTEYSEHMILEEEQAPLSTALVETQEQQINLLLLTVKQELTPLI